MKELRISRQEAGQRMDKYLFKVLSGAGSSLIYKSLRKKNIVLNDSKATGKETLKEGDSVKVYFSDETFEKFSGISGKVSEASKGKPDKDMSEGNKTGPTVDRRYRKPEVVFENEDILVINKPAGMLSQKSSPKDYSANDLIIDYLKSTGSYQDSAANTFKPSIVNRLDRNTSGLIVAGKSIKGLQEMSKAFHDRSVKKYYLALVQGKVTEERHLSGYLSKDRDTNKVTVVSRASLKKDKVSKLKDAKPIELSYSPLCVYKKGSKYASLLKVHLITGKSHQIRAQLSDAGYPIFGDIKYGKADSSPKGRIGNGTEHMGQLLAAYRMEFEDGRIIQISMPEAFRDVINDGYVLEEAFGEQVD